MLIFFHYFVLFIFQLLRNRKRLKAQIQAEISSDVDEKDLEINLKFDPPVYKQRYIKVYETLIDEKWRNNLKKLVDFGCAEYSLFIYIKNLNIVEILFVDIDDTLLDEKIGKLEPLLADYVKRRSCPMEVSAYRGSVIDPDYRLRKTDVVTAIELIEHLYPDTLDAFPYNIFSFIRPKLVIITTPNADFNVAFQRTGFRHPDHKFEWTREQFEDWATNIVQRFPDYTVEFSGLGEIPKRTESIGCCSQAATFTRKDVFSDKYISSLYARPCQCDKTSPCKGQTTESKLLCSCLCGFCLPDFSVGVCTYLSCNLSESEAYRPMKADRKKSLSDTDLTFKSQLSYLKRAEINSDFNPSYNIFYKLIQKIDYPYEIDLRPESERLMETFKYRIHAFSYACSRFYVESRERCEIPVMDIIYGDIHITAEEARRLLCDAGYQVEKCINLVTKEPEYCIISMPHEMEDIPSSSETTDEYSSRSSEPNEGTQFESNNIEFLSDWDEIDYGLKEKLPASEQGATSSSLEPSSIEPKKLKSDPLFDSGYLKSPSPLETNQKLPQDNPESTETDHFEDVGTTPNLCSEDNKLHLKKTTAKEKFVGIIPNAAENHKAKVDPNRVNELDRFRNTKGVMEAFLVPQDFKMSKDLCVAGTSSSCKKSRKFKDKEKKSPEKKEFKEPTVLDDAKSLTNCIIQNSLNIIEVDAEISPPLELIQDLSPLQEPQDMLEIMPREQQNEPIAEPVIAPNQAVENGDLANNNRDNEGNNLIEDDLQEQDIDEGIDLLNDNLEELIPLLEDNVNLMENNNDQQQVIEEPQEVVAEPGEEANNDANEIIELEADENSVGQASREVLYDANSIPDLLEDFDIPPQANQDNSFDLLDFGNSVIFMGIHPISSIGSRREQSTEAGSHVVPEEEALASFGRHDEPHFYCQGDGLGVHPSIIAVDVDETEDADNDTTTEESSSNNTTDFAEIDPGPSDMYDMSSLPEESSAANSMVEDNIVRTAGHDNGRGQHENKPPTPQHSIEDRLIATQEGSNIVNHIISEAVNEIATRTLSSTNMQKDENNSWSTCENLPSCSKPQTLKCRKKPQGVNKEATNESETSLEYFPDSMTPSSIAPTTSDISEDSIILSLPKKEVVSKQNTDSKEEIENSLLEIASFNTSEESEYFDPKSEEF